MQTKEYRLSKTIKKTARENLLLISTTDSKVLYDFDLLTAIPELTDDDNSVIISEMLKGCSWDRETVDIVCPDDFTHYVIVSKYAFHNVFSKKTGKKLYRIKELTKVEVTKASRTCLWNKFDDESYVSSNGHSEPALDIEI